MATMSAFLLMDKREVAKHSLWKATKRDSTWALSQGNFVFTRRPRENSLKFTFRRTIRKIFHETKDLEEKGWKYRLDASFLEIYNEDIRDLLATEKGLKYDIKKVDTKTNEIYVTNVKTEDVTNGDNINSLLKRAKKNRAVAATNCNERSSRSHSVFMLKITGKNAVTSESCTGTLNLVDLAGSERLKDSGSTGQRLEETKNINSSLSNLSKVIMALANHKVRYHNHFQWFELTKFSILGWPHTVQRFKTHSLAHELFGWQFQNLDVCQPFPARRQF